MNRTRMLAAVAALLLAASASGQASTPPIVEGELAARIDEYLARCVPFGFSGSVVVGKNAKLILCKGYGCADRKTGAACTQDTLFDIGALSEQFTASLVLVLEQRGVLKLTDTIDRFLDAVPAEKRKIQIRHLLTHTSGLPHELPTTKAEKFYGKWTRHVLPLAPVEIRAHASLARAVLGTSLEFEPGSKHAPSNIGYGLLAAIAEAAVRKPYDEALRELVLDPAGLEHTGVRGDRRLDASLAARGTPESDDLPPPGSILEIDPSRIEGRGDDKLLATEGWYTWGLRGAGGVLTSVSDLWKWERALQANSILTANSRKKLFTPFVGDTACAWYEEDAVRGMGSVERGDVTSNGFHAAFDRHPSQHLFVAVLGNVTDCVGTIRENVSKLALGMEVELPPATVRLTDEELQSWCGEYSGPSWRPEGQALAFRVREAGAELWLEALDEGAFTLLNAKGGRFGPNPNTVERTRTILAGFLRADFTALRAAESPQHPTAFVYTWWPALLAHHGALRSATYLGEDLGAGDDVNTWVALDFEQGSEILRLEWFKKELRAISLGPPYVTNLRIAPESATRAVAWSFRGWLDLHATLATTATGATLTVRGSQLTRVNPR